MLVLVAFSPSLMRFIVSDMPFDDRTPQEEIERRRAERLARGAKRRSTTKRKRLLRENTLARKEKAMFPNLTGEFDEDSPLAKHWPRKRDQ
jgi:hypothetical protein